MEWSSSGQALAHRALFDDLQSILKARFAENVTAHGWDWRFANNATLADGATDFQFWFIVWWVILILKFLLFRLSSMFTGSWTWTRALRAIDIHASFAYHVYWYTSTNDFSSQVNCLDFWCRLADVWVSVALIWLHFGSIVTVLRKIRVETTTAARKAARHV